MLNLNSSRQWFLVLVVLALGACGGSGGPSGGGSSNGDGAPNGSDETVLTGSVSGTLLPPPDTSVDPSINDRQAQLREHDQCEEAYDIDARTTLHGFASAVPTGGSAEAEHFAESSNSSDFYRVYLNMGQTMQLEVADYQEGSRDLALYLWNADCSRQVDVSDSGEIEEVASLLGGEHVVEVRAKAGVNKYVLRGAASWDTAENESELVTLGNDLPELETYEVIVTFDSDAGNQAHEGLSNALNQAQGLELRYQHQQRGRATLATVSGLPGSGAGLSRAMELLRSLNPTVFKKLNTLRMIDFLAQQPGVRYAEPNVRVVPQREPNDPRYGDQWHYEQIDLPQAWDLTLGDSSTGVSPIVAVLDTGVYLDHEDLLGKLVGGHDFYNDDSDPDETSSVNSWHGTHVAGTLGAATDNGTGVAGAGWSARIMPIRVLGEEGGSRYDVIQGVRYAAGMENDSGSGPLEPADVINLSLGGGGHSRTEQDLYHQVRERGLTLVAAAGNEGSDEPLYPAAYDGVLSVSATNCNEERTGYSNQGPSISLAAPGGDNSDCGFLASGLVLSTVGEGSGDSRSSAYSGLAGTSMAAPHVSGVLALMYAVYPDLNPDDVDALLADGQLTDDLGETGRDDYFGHGQINARKAVEAAQALAGGAQQPGRVVVDPPTLYLGHESEAVVVLRQEGEGETPSVTGWQSDTRWLSAEPQNVDDQGLGDYLVLVDRDQFSNDERGNFEGDLTFTLEDDSELIVGVHIQVGTAAEVAPIYVMLLDPDSGKALYQTSTARSETGELSFRFENVEAGGYHLLAGSDVDVDGFICQPGEMCGVYLEYEEREILSIADGIDLEQKDFELDILSRFRPLDGIGPEPVARP